MQNMKDIKKTAVVSIIMGSQSDWETMQYAVEILDNLSIKYEVKIVSAHRTPDRLYKYAKLARSKGIKVIIAGAGGAAHLPGMVASLTHIPVLGVPILTKALRGMDSLMSIVQMPAGIPVGSLAIGNAGAKNAAILAAQILATNDSKLEKNVKNFRLKQTKSVSKEPDFQN
tara:strand:- start:1342 stop:1854 length:513 start_codon:yes stop_codon:yes gene_type:complete